MKMNILLFVLAGFLLSSCENSKTILFNGKNLNGWEIILNDDSAKPENVFFAEDGVIKSTGVPHGYLRTIEVYANYKLHLEWRWTAEPTNSGVLVHANGYQFWPVSIEAQLMNQNAGDIIFIGKGMGGTVGDSTFFNTEKRFSRAEKFLESNEKEPGAWNSYDIICDRDKITIYVNGELQNEAENMTLSGGSIALQSEGSPIEFRNIYLEVL